MTSLRATTNINPYASNPLVLVGAHKPLPTSSNQNSSSNPLDDDLQALIAALAAAGDSSTPSLNLNKPAVAISLTGAIASAMVMGSQALGQVLAKPNEEGIAKAKRISKLLKTDKLSKAQQTALQKRAYEIILHPEKIKLPKPLQEMALNNEQREAFLRAYKTELLCFARSVAARIGVIVASDGDGTVTYKGPGASDSTSAVSSNKDKAYMNMFMKGSSLLSSFLADELGAGKPEVQEVLQDVAWFRFLTMRAGFVSGVVYYRPPTSPELKATRVASLIDDLLLETGIGNNPDHPLWQKIGIQGFGGAAYIKPGGDLEIKGRGYEKLIGAVKSFRALNTVKSAGWEGKAQELLSPKLTDKEFLAKYRAYGNEGVYFGGIEQEFAMLANRLKFRVMEIKGMPLYFTALSEAGQAPNLLQYMRLCKLLDAALKTHLNNVSDKQSWKKNFLAGLREHDIVRTLPAGFLDALNRGDYETPAQVWAHWCEMQTVMMTLHPVDGKNSLASTEADYKKLMIEVWRKYEKRPEFFQLANAENLKRLEKSGKAPVPVLADARALASQHTKEAHAQLCAILDDLNLKPVEKIIYYKGYGTKDNQYESEIKEGLNEESGEFLFTNNGNTGTYAESGCSLPKEAAIVSYLTENLSQRMRESATNEIPEALKNHIEIMRGDSFSDTGAMLRMIFDAYANKDQALKNFDEHTAKHMRQERFSQADIAKTRKDIAENGHWAGHLDRGQVETDSPEFIKRLIELSVKGDYARDKSDPNEKELEDRLRAKYPFALEKIPNQKDQFKLVGEKFDSADQGKKMSKDQLIALFQQKTKYIDLLNIRKLPDIFQNNASTAAAMMHLLGGEDLENLDIETFMKDYVGNNSDASRIGVSCTMPSKTNLDKMLEVSHPEGFWSPQMKFARHAPQLAMSAAAIGAVMSLGGVTSSVYSAIKDGNKDEDKNGIPDNQDLLKSMQQATGWGFSLSSAALGLINVGCRSALFPYSLLGTTLGVITGPMSGYTQQFAMLGSIGLQMLGAAHMGTEDVYIDQPSQKEMGKVAKAFKGYKDPKTNWLYDKESLKHGVEKTYYHPNALSSRLLSEMSELEQTLIGKKGWHPWLARLWSSTKLNLDLLGATIKQPNLLRMDLKIVNATNGLERNGIPHFLPAAYNAVGFTALAILGAATVARVVDHLQHPNKEANLSEEEKELATYKQSLEKSFGSLLKQDISSVSSKPQNHSELAQSFQLLVQDLQTGDSKASANSAKKVTGLLMTLGATIPAVMFWIIGGAISKNAFGWRLNWSREVTGKQVRFRPAMIGNLLRGAAVGQFAGGLAMGLTQFGLFGDNTLAKVLGSTLYSLASAFSMLVQGVMVGTGDIGSLAMREFLAKGKGGAKAGGFIANPVETALAMAEKNGLKGERLEAAKREVKLHHGARETRRPVGV